MANSSRVLSDPPVCALNHCGLRPLPQEGRGWMGRERFGRKEMLRAKKGPEGLEWA